MNSTKKEIRLFKGISIFLSLSLVCSGVLIYQLNQKLREKAPTITIGATEQKSKNSNYREINQLETKTASHSTSTTKQLHTPNQDPFSEEELDSLTTKHIEIDLIINQLKPEIRKQYEPFFEDLGLVPEVKTALIRQLIEMERRKQNLLLVQESLANLQSNYDRTLRESLTTSNYEAYRQYERGKESDNLINQLASEWEDFFQTPLPIDSQQTLIKLFSELGGSSLVSHSSGPYASPPQIDHAITRAGSTAKEHLIIDKLSLLNGDLQYLKNTFSNEPILTDIETLYSARIAELEESLSNSN